jgi:hypothetical protein
MSIRFRLGRGVGGSLRGVLGGGVAAAKVAEPAFAGGHVIPTTSVPCGLLGELPQVLRSLLRRFRNRDLEEVILDSGCGWEGTVGIGEL